MKKTTNLMIDNKDTTKYPKSKNKLQCIGPCYFSGVTYVHPITAEYHTAKKATCPIHDEYIDDEGNPQTLYFDECNNPTFEKDSKEDNLYSNMALPFISLNSGYFLKKFYNIYSFENAIDWLEKKKNSPIRTKERIVESAWNAYGKNLDIVDQRITDFYLDLIKKKWITYIVNDIEPYIEVDEKTKKISFDKNGKNKDDKFRIEKTNFILEKFITRDDIYKFLIKYTKYYQKTWDDIENHNALILKDLIDYIKKKITISS